jgi:hypothetical protein
MTMVSPFLPILQRDISDLEKPGAAGYGGACLLRGKNKNSQTRWFQPNKIIVSVGSLSPKMWMNIGISKICPHDVIHMDIRIRIFTIFPHH